MLSVCSGLWTTQIVHARKPTGSRHDLLGFTLNAYFLGSPPPGPGRKAMCQCRYHEQFFFYKPKAHPLIFKIYFLQKL